MRIVTSLIKTETLKLVYFAYFIPPCHEIIWEVGKIKQRAEKYFTSTRDSSE
jgi:hypothetical protein